MAGHESRKRAARELLGAVAGWAVLGALGVGALTFAGLAVWFLAFETRASAQDWLWQAFAAILGGLAAAAAGFLLGAIIPLALAVFHARANRNEN
jgi:hypothetical protein